MVVQCSGLKEVSQIASAIDFFFVGLGSNADDFLQHNQKPGQCAMNSRSGCQRWELAARASQILFCFKIRKPTPLRDI